MVFRIYECHGARGTAHLHVNFPFNSAHFCDILEREISPATVREGKIGVPYAPFKILTLKIKPQPHES